jgi:hypothetical protein
MSALEKMQHIKVKKKYLAKAIPIQRIITIENLIISGLP